MLHQAMLFCAGEEGSIKWLSKHLDGKVLQNSYIAKLPTIKLTLATAGFADGLCAANFSWQRHYVPGRQLVTTDQIREILGPENWKLVDDTLFPGLDAMQASVNARGNKQLSDSEADFRAQVRLAWEYRETILQDVPLLYSEHGNTRLFRDVSLFVDPSSPFMQCVLDKLQPVLRNVQEMSNRAHDSLVRQRGTSTSLDKAREIYGYNGSRSASTKEDSRQLLVKMTELDAERLGNPLPQPQLQTVTQIRPQQMPMFPLYVTQAGLLVLWQYWGKHMRQYYLPSYSIPPKPPLALLEFSGTIRSNIDQRKNMLLELDRQVEAMKRSSKIRDDDRKQAASKVISIWEAKMKAYAWVRANKQAGKGLTINEVGAGFRQAVGKTGDVQVELKKPNHKDKGLQVLGSAYAFLQYFGA